jgi:hypothetical protein
VESGRRRGSRAFKRARRLNCHRNFKPLVFTQFQPVVDTAHGFRLHGASTLALWAVVALYFFVGWRYAGGIRRPQPDDVGTTPIASDLPGSVRAGVWRRMLALSIDSLIVSVLFQLIVAVLFVATSGRIQMYGDVAYTSCSKLETMPEGLAPPPLAGANFARECNVYFLGAQTARILQVGHATNEGKATEAASQNYMLDQDGHPIDGLDRDARTDRLSGRDGDANRCDVG